MRDERTKFLAFVNTWMDGVPSNLDKFSKMEDELEQEGKNGEERKGEEQRARSQAGRRVYIGTSLVPVHDTNQD